MRKDAAVLVGALVATNAAWATYALTGSRDAAPPRDSAALGAARDPAPSLESMPLGEGNPPSPGLAAAPRPAGTAMESEPAGIPAPPTARPPSEPAAVPHRPAPVASGIPGEIQAWRADVLQIEDPARRERGLTAIAGALRSPDAPTA